jgi:hypothetical protein
VKPVLPSREQIEQALDAQPDLPFRDSIAAFEVRVGPDATGDPSVWVWVALRVWPLPYRERDELRDRVRAAVASIAPTAENIYIRFR